MTARQSSNISLELLRVKAINITAIQIKRMVKNIEMYFIPIIIQFLEHNYQKCCCFTKQDIIFTFNLLKQQSYYGLSLSSYGVWRSWLARAVWDREVEGSNPFTPTKQNGSRKRPFLFGSCGREGFEPLGENCQWQSGNGSSPASLLAWQKFGARGTWANPFTPTNRILCKKSLLYGDSFLLLLQYLSV